MYGVDLFPTPLNDCVCDLFESFEVLADEECGDVVAKLGDLINQLLAVFLKQIDFELNKLVDVAEVENVGQVNPKILFNHLHNLIMVLLTVELIESVSDLRLVLLK